MSSENVKKAILLGLLMVFLLAIWAFVLHEPSPPGPTLTEKRPSDADQRTSTVFENEREWLERLAALRRVGRGYIYRDRGVRDPMVPLVSGGKTLRKVYKPRMKTPKFHLSGVIWDRRAPVAIINGLPLRENEVIEGARLLKIKRDSVILLLGSKELILKLSSN
ncbi:MAG TPA: hypothetical protein EYP53_00045 [Candidatus Latescibacteria bacterium]|nr:hypothetical protein [Candidatus Latescibacterota bacterium]